MLLQQLRRELEAEKLRPFYLLLGPPGFSRDLARWLLRRQLGRSGELTVERYDLREQEPPKALLAARNYHLFAAARLILVEGVEALDGSQTGPAAGDLEVLVARPIRGTVVALEAEKLDRRGPLYRSLSRHCRVLELREPERGDAVAWARQELETNGIAAGPEVAQLLVDLVGKDFHALKNEVEKLAAYAAGGGQVTSEIVEELVAVYKEHDLFELSNALLGRDARRAFHVLDTLLRSTSSASAQAILVVWLLGRHFRQLLVAHELVSRGSSRYEVERALAELDARTRDVNALMRQARSFARRQLEQGLALAAEADLTFKSKSMNPTDKRLYLEQLIGRLSMKAAEGLT